MEIIGTGIKTISSNLEVLTFPLSHEFVKHVFWVLTLAMRSMAVFIHKGEDTVVVDLPA